MLAFTVYLIGFVIAFFGSVSMRIYELKTDIFYSHVSKARLEMLKWDVFYDSLIFAIFWPLVVIVPVIAFPFTVTFKTVEKLVDLYIKHQTTGNKS